MVYAQSITRLVCQKDNTNRIFKELNKLLTTLAYPELYANPLQSLAKYRQSHLKVSVYGCPDLKLGGIELCFCIEPGGVGLII